MKCTKDEPNINFCFFFQIPSNQIPYKDEPSYSHPAMSEERDSTFLLNNFVSSIYFFHMYQWSPVAKDAFTRLHEQNIFQRAFM